MEDPSNTLATATTEDDWVSIGASFDEWTLDGLNFSAFADAASAAGSRGSRVEYSLCLRSWADTSLARVACANPVKVDSSPPSGFDVSVVTGIPQALLGNYLLLSWTAEPEDGESGIDLTWYRRAFLWSESRTERPPAHLHSPALPYCNSLVGLDEVMLSPAFTANSIIRN